MSRRVREQATGVGSISPESRMWQEALTYYEGREERGANIAPGALLDFARRRSQPKWIDGAHLTLIASTMQRAITRAADGNGVKQIITAPPRHGKTHLVSVISPVWGIGNFRSLKFILASYAAKLATSKSSEARDLMREIGPSEFGVRLNDEYSTKADWRIAGFGGRLISTGVGGTLTGEGGNVGIIDDPFKNWKEANSVVIREAVWQWYQTVFSTRIEAGGSIVLMHTRWHEDDLVGRLLTEFGSAKDGGEWEVLDLQALSEGPKTDTLKRPKGKALWPQRGWDEKQLAAKRRQVGEYAFSALYQGRPQPSKGTLFRRLTFRYCYAKKGKQVGRDGKVREVDGIELVLRDGPKQPTKKEWVALEDCWGLIACDTALSTKKEADYFVCSYWLITPPIAGRYRRILRHVFRDRVEAPDQVDVLTQQYEAWKPVYIAIESAQAGLATIQHARRANLPIYEVKADADKVSRALPLTAAYQGFDVFHYQGEAWLGAWEDELLQFPRGAHDDQVDTGAYAEALIRQTEGVLAQVYIPGVTIKTARQRESDKAVPDERAALEAAKKAIRGG